MSTLSRRQLLRTLTGTALALGVTSALPIHAQGNGYQLVQPPQNTSIADKVEVLEFFWLGCPHCYSLEPDMLAWEARMPANTVMVREAPPLNPSWEQHSRGFYAARALGIEEPFVHAMFKAIHEDGERMRSPDDIADLAQTLGADRDKFLGTMESFTVETALRRSVQLARGAGITGVPSIMINGKYLTGASLAGGNAGIIDVIDRMVAIEKAQMGLE